MASGQQGSENAHRIALPIARGLETGRAQLKRGTFLGLICFTETEKMMTQSSHFSRKPSVTGDTPKQSAFGL